ncbi:MAG: hypothetical protein Q9166_000200 [cf. Caloplaca sp. 2 TL-2023]
MWKRQSPTDPQIDDRSYAEIVISGAAPRTQPPRPYTYTSAVVPPPSSMCQMPSCPIQFPHAEGLFLDRGEPHHWIHDQLDFGASNPPLEIWYARERLLNDMGNQSDRAMVSGFLQYHYVPRQAPEVRQYSPSVTSSEDHDMTMMELTEGMAETTLRTQAPTSHDPQQPSDPFLAAEPGPGHRENADRPQSPAQQPEGPAESAIDAEIVRLLEGQTETSSDAELDRHLSEAFFEMELEDAQEGAARMGISGGEAEATTATEPVESRSQEQTRYK